MVDYLIVGCGFSGATMAERIARELGKKVLIIDRRDHIGGNAFDEADGAGILVSRYGAHIFHTNDAGVWKYVTRFASFSHYVHTVDAEVGGKMYPLPLNLDTINAFFHLRLTSDELPRFLDARREAIPHPANAEEAVVSQVGWELYDAFYRNYTKKQWGVDPRELDASVTSRLPVRHSSDRRYFADIWQGMPLGGYSRLIRTMLDHRNIEVRLGTDYLTAIAETHFDKMIFTGRIDEFFGYVHGKLPYRSIDFRFETLDREHFQHTAVVNYPNEHDYTRSVEYKYLYGERHPKTTISREYPCWNDEEPCYPVPSPENRALHRKYREEAGKLGGSVIFSGRLGSYQYFNMDQCIAQGLHLFEKEIARSGQVAEAVEEGARI